MILIIDNYDSFVYNLADYVQRLGADAQVYRNDALSLEDIKNLGPSAIIISPGPCAPQQAGISIQAVKELGAQIPILGVCLGHQAIGEAYGGQTLRGKEPVHGKASRIDHDGSGLFFNLPSPIVVGRYHSLIVDLPKNSPLKITAMNDQEEIMAMQHQHYPVYGVQFHPESILTPLGLEIIRNFLVLAHDWNTEQERSI